MVPHISRIPNHRIRFCNSPIAHSGLSSGLSRSQIALISAHDSCCSSHLSGATYSSEICSELWKKLWLIIILIRLNIPPLLCRESQNGVAFCIVVHSLFLLQHLYGRDTSVISHFSPKIIANCRLCRRANSAALYLILFNWMNVQMSAAALRHPRQRQTTWMPVWEANPHEHHWLHPFSCSSTEHISIWIANAVRAVRSGPVYGQLMTWLCRKRQGWLKVEIKWEILLFASLGWHCQCQRNNSNGFTCYVSLPDVYKCQCS